MSSPPKLDIPTILEAIKALPPRTREDEIAILYGPKKDAEAAIDKATKGKR